MGATQGIGRPEQEGVIVNQFMLIATHPSDAGEYLQFQKRGTSEGTGYSEEGEGGGRGQSGEWKDALRRSHQIWLKRRAASFLFSFFFLSFVLCLFLSPTAVLQRVGCESA